MARKRNTSSAPEFKEATGFVKGWVGFCGEALLEVTCITKFVKGLIGVALKALAPSTIFAGAVVGAITAAINGQNILKGALKGFVSAAIFHAAGNFIDSRIAAGGISKSGKAAVHFAAGAASGAAAAAIDGGDIGQGAVIGGITGYVSKYTTLSTEQLYLDHQYIATTVAGGVSGGIAYKIYGGSFNDGFVAGMEQASTAFIHNTFVHAVYYATLYGIPYMAYRMSPALRWIQTTGAYRWAAALIPNGSKVVHRGFQSFNAFKSEFGRAGDKMAWHHIVEQTPKNLARFGNEAIHNTGNLIRLPHYAGSVHMRISGHYSSIQPFTGGVTVREWLSNQSFQQQMDYGVKMVIKYGGSEWLKFMK